MGKKIVVAMAIIVILVASAIVMYLGLLSILDTKQETNALDIGFSARIDSSGGTIEVNDPSSPLHRVKIEIPEGALDKKVSVTLVPFLETDVEQHLGNLHQDIRFFGGITIDGDGANLKKTINIQIPNPRGATSDDQLLVGQVVNLDKNHSLMVYKGVARAGSPITFSVANFGSFGILSPTMPLGLISGTYANPSGNPVSDGIVATSFSKPFVAYTDASGSFEIPAGPAGSYVTVIGIHPIEYTPGSSAPTRGIGLKGVQLPEIISPPTSLIDVVVTIVMDELEIEPPPYHVLVIPLHPSFFHQRSSLNHPLYYLQKKAFRLICTV